MSNKETSKEQIICPECKSDDLEMIGDPEYNDEWHCNSCGYSGGSAYGIPSNKEKKEEE